MKKTKLILFLKPQGCITNGEEPTPTQITNFQDHLEQCEMEIPYEDDELGLAGIVMKEDEFKEPRLSANGEPSTVQVMQHQQK